MGEGSERQPPEGVGLHGQEELRSLSARVAELERQIADLSSRVAVPAALTGQIQAEPSRAISSVASTGGGVPPPPPMPFEPVAASSRPARKSLENQLGSQVFSRVGILVVLIAMALFLKLAIDNQWIGPTGRVVAGLVAGAGLVVWSERFRSRGFGAFSYTLKAVGSGVLYLSLWAAFQLYHLLPGGVALAAMLLVTGWNAYMAWSQDAEVLAAYALIGGCATPLLLSTGGNHEGFLFTYLVALDVATVALVRLRPWPQLLLGVFPATVAYFIGWYIQFYSADQLSLTCAFVALFFVVFASVPVARSAMRKEDADGTSAKRGDGSVLTEVLLPLANAAFGSLAFYSVLQDSAHHAALPWMMLLFSAAYLGIMRLPQSAVASAIHLSLGIVFLTIAIPLKASGHWITVSWLVEGSALLWVAAALARSTVRDDAPAVSRVLRSLAAGCLLLGFAGILVRLYGYSPVPLTAFFNHRFATALVGIAAFSFAAWTAFHATHHAFQDDADNAKTPKAEPQGHVWVQICGGSIIAANLVAILATVTEISALWGRSAGNTEGDLQRALAISAFLMAYGGVLLAIGFWRRSAFVRWQALLLIVYTIAKTFVYDMRNLSQGYRVASFLALGVLLLGVSFAYQNDWLALREKPAGPLVDTLGPEESR